MEHDRKKARMLDDEADVWQHKSDLEGIDSHHEGIEYNTLNDKKHSNDVHYGRYINEK